MVGQDLDLVSEIVSTGANSVEEVLIVLDRLGSVTIENTTNACHRKNFLDSVQFFGIPTASLKKNPVYLVFYRKVEINLLTKEVFVI